MIVSKKKDFKKKSILPKIKIKFREDQNNIEKDF